MQTAFVTGANGFIGSHLATRLAASGVRVRCLVRSDKPCEYLEAENIERVIGDITDPSSYAQALDGCDTVFHAAGIICPLTREQLFHVNGTACGLLADACLTVEHPPRIVYISSIAAAGPPPRGKPVREESDPLAPISQYGHSKRLGESEFQRRADRLAITVLRPGVVYGPRDPKMAELYRAIKRMRLHMVVGFRSPPLSLIHVDDLVEMAVAAAECGERLEGSPDGSYTPRGYYFACDDVEFPSYAEFGRRIARSLDRRAIVCPLFRWVGLTCGYVVQTTCGCFGGTSMINVDKIREAIASSWATSSTKARRDLQFAPPQPLDQRLKQTARWFLEEGWI